jgi:hypothetical protein
MKDRCSVDQTLAHGQCRVGASHARATSLVPVRPGGSVAPSEAAERRTATVRAARNSEWSADVRFGAHSDLSRTSRHVRKVPTASQEAANRCSLALSVCSPPMAMMPPTIVVAAVPTIVVAATAVMAPPMPVSVAAFDLSDCPIGIAQRIGCCCGHSRCRHDWCKCKSTAGKSDYQKPLHLSPSSFVVSGSADYQVCYCNAG